MKLLVNKVPSTFCCIWPIGFSLRIVTENEKQLNCIRSSLFLAPLLSLGMKTILISSSIRPVVNYWGGVFYAQFLKMFGMSLFVALNYFDIDLITAIVVVHMW